MDADGRLNLSPDGEFQPVAVDFHNDIRTFTKSYVRNLGTKNEMILCQMTFVNLKKYILVKWKKNTKNILTYFTNRLICNIMISRKPEEI